MTDFYPFPILPPSLPLTVFGTCWLQQAPLHASPSPLLCFPDAELLERMKDGGLGTIVQKCHFKKNSGLQSIEPSCRVGSLPAAHPATLARSSLRVTCPVTETNVALCSLLEATVAIYGPLAYSSAQSWQG